MRPTPDPIEPGQESVWGYPRPAIAMPSQACIRIQQRGRVIAATSHSIRTIETSHPLSYYIPTADIMAGVLFRATGGSFCEWKGCAVYWDIVIGNMVLSKVGWSYPEPTPAFAALRDHVAFYAAAFDRCSVDDQVVTPQPGGFYGGWITSAVVGSFKGVPGSQGCDGRAG